MLLCSKWRFNVYDVINDVTDDWIATTFLFIIFQTALAGNHKRNAMRLNCVIPLISTSGITHLISLNDSYVKTDICKHIINKILNLDMCACYR